MQEIELELKSFDYSLLSIVRERLLQRFLKMRRNRRNNTILLNNLMTEDELDYVSAAGVNYVNIKEENK